MGELKRRQIRAADQLQSRICFSSAPLGGCSLAQRLCSECTHQHLQVCRARPCCNSNTTAAPCPGKNPPLPPQPLEFQALSRTLFTACFLCLLGEDRLIQQLYWEHVHIGVRQTDKVGALRAGVALHRRPPAPQPRGYLLTPGDPARRSRLC